MSNNGGTPPFPYVKPSSDHTVLYKIPGKHASDTPPQPFQTFQGDRWDDNHVRMPHSIHNQYEKSFLSFKNMTTESRWGVIEKALSKKINSSNDLIKAILKYNGKFKDVWTFRALDFYLNKHLTKNEREDFFRNILPGIINLALKLPHLIQAPLPLLRQFQNRSISLSQQQIASLLANAFLCTFPWRNTAYQNTTYAKLPKINFTLLYEGTEESVFQKLRCICNYFKRVISKPPLGVVTFSRRFVPSHLCPDWEHATDLIHAVPVYVNSVLNIEDAKGQIQVDFANKFLGGGVLGTGLVQEEIRFLICPELMASMIFTESLTDQEALMIIGCERYNNYTGYGRESFRWAGDYQDHTPFDSSRRRQCAVLAIDAIPYWDQHSQFKKHMILRELTKAWIGFTFFQNNSETLQFPPVATGNWGCGAFNGAPQLKCLIQMMAAAAAKRILMYYTFGDEHHAKEVQTAYELCTQHSVTIGGLFKSLMEYDYTKTDLHSFLKQKLEDKLEKYRNRYTDKDKTNENKTNEKEERHAQRKDFDVEIEGSFTGNNHRPVDTQRETHNQRYKHNTSSYEERHTQRKDFDVEIAGSSTGNNHRPVDTQRETHNNQIYKHNTSSYEERHAQRKDFDEEIAGSSTGNNHRPVDTQRETHNQRYNHNTSSYEERHAQRKDFDVEIAGTSTGNNHGPVDTQRGTHNQRYKHNTSSSSYECHNKQYKKKCDNTSGNYTGDGESTRRFGQHSQNYAEGRGSGHSQKGRKYSGHSQNKCLDYPRSNYDPNTNQTPTNPIPVPDLTQKRLYSQVLANKKNDSANMYGIMRTAPPSSRPAAEGGQNNRTKMSAATFIAETLTVAMTLRAELMDCSDSVSVNDLEKR